MLKAYYVHTSPNVDEYWRLYWHLVPKIQILHWWLKNVLEFRVKGNFGISAEHCALGGLGKCTIRELPVNINPGLNVQAHTSPNILKETWNATKSNVNVCVFDRRFLKLLFWMSYWLTEPWTEKWKRPFQWWAGCGIWLYQFLIIAYLFTLIAIMKHV